MIRYQTISERMEKVRINSTKLHHLDENGLNELSKLFKSMAKYKKGKVNPDGFIKFIQYLHNEAFRNGMIHALEIMQKPYHI